MEAKWTKGPWKQNSLDKVEAGRFIYSLEGSYDGGASTMHETQANAKLIAAAPEMAELLERMVDTQSKPEWGLADLEGFKSTARRILARIKS